MAAAVAIACAIPASNAVAGAPQANTKTDTPLDLPLEAKVTNPDWRATPSGDEMANEYPKLAQLMNVPGEATMTCTVDTDGRLQDCKVIGESPAGFGFGAAIMRLSAYFDMKPAQIDGVPVKAKITIPIKFKLAGATDEAAEPEPPPPTSAAALELAHKILTLQGAPARLQDRWRPLLVRMSSETVLDGDVISSTAALDAFQQGLDDVIQATIEHQARIIAAKMNEAELRATLSYFESPTGKAWLAASFDLATPKDFNKRLATAARGHLCAKAACGADGRLKSGQASNPN